jgi:hypothetical protein
MPGKIDSREQLRELVRLKREDDENQRKLGREMAFRGIREEARRTVFRYKEDTLIAALKYPYRIAESREQIAFAKWVLKNYRKPITGK